MEYFEIEYPGWLLEGDVLVCCELPAGALPLDLRAWVPTTTGEDSLTVKAYLGEDAVSAEAALYYGAFLAPGATFPFQTQSPSVFMHERLTEKLLLTLVVQQATATDTGGTIIGAVTYAI